MFKDKLTEMSKNALVILEMLTGDSETDCWWIITLDLSPSQTSQLQTLDFISIKIDIIMLIE